jgi:hypothetical protein
MREQSGKMKCLNCQNELKYTFADLGTSPLCEEFVKPDHINKGQTFYPLHAYVCEECLLVQVGEYVSPEEIYEDYYYYSSYSDSWLQHAKNYVEMMVNGHGYGINRESFVVEIASNDGYLLQYFKDKEIPILGVEPSENVARESIKKGIPTEKVFFGEKTAEKLKEKYQPADLILGNNVLAHVPKINDFIKGLDVMLSEKGIMTFEFPHLMQLVDNNQFDTIYHEHFFYYSLISVQAIFKKHGMKIFDVQELSTHGGSIRIFITRETNEDRPVSDNVKRILALEKEKGYLDINFYKSFDENVQQTKREILTLLIDLKRQGKTIAGYGAPGKGNTLLNYCGIGTDFIDYTVDRNPNKHGYYLPGSLIPIHHPDKIKETKPDYVFILPWNLKDEIIEQISYVRDWGGKFIIPIPEPVVI